MMNDNETLKKLEELQKEVENLSKKIGVFARDYASRKDDVEDTGEYNEEKVVTNYLIKLGMSTSILGFKYSRQAVILVLNGEQEKRLYITKKLYPDIAKKFNTTSSRVERAIRHAVRTVYEKNRDSELMEEMMLTTRKCCPTNSEFLAFIAEKIRLEN